MYVISTTCIYVFTMFINHRMLTSRSWVTNHFLYFLRITLPLCTVAYHEETSKWILRQKLVTFQVIAVLKYYPMKLKCQNTKVHNKLSVTKDNIKIELECKGCISPSGNILCFSSITKPWLDMYEKICSK